MELRYAEYDNSHLVAAILTLVLVLSFAVGCKIPSEYTVNVCIKSGDSTCAIVDTVRVN